MGVLFLSHQVDFSPSHRGEDHRVFANTAGGKRPVVYFKFGIKHSCFSPTSAVIIGIWKEWRNMREREKRETSEMYQPFDGCRFRRLLFVVTCSVSVPGGSEARSLFFARDQEKTAIQEIQSMLIVRCTEE